MVFLIEALWQLFMQSVVLAWLWWAPLDREWDLQLDLGGAFGWILGICAAFILAFIVALAMTFKRFV